MFYSLVSANMFLCSRDVKLKYSYIWTNTNTIKYIPITFNKINVNWNKIKIFFYIKFYVVF